jgi:hypothetical protein
MGKYATLGSYLRGRGSDSISVSFAEVEQILGAPLPASARTHRSWWSNNPENNVATREWLAAGYQTERVDLRGGKVVFRRQHVPTQVADALAPVWNVQATTMTRKATKEHPLFGALKGTVYIPPGVDLTEPALDPDWEEAWLKKWDERLADPEWQKLRPKKDE